MFLIRGLETPLFQRFLSVALEKGMSADRLDLCHNAVTIDQNTGQRLALYSCVLSQPRIRGRYERRDCWIKWVIRLRVIQSFEPLFRGLSPARYASVARVRLVPEA